MDPDGNMNVFFFWAALCALLAGLLQAFYWGALTWLEERRGQEPGPGRAKKLAQLMDQRHRVEASVSLGWLLLGGAGYLCLYLAIYPLLAERLFPGPVWDLAPFWWALGLFVPYALLFVALCKVLPAALGRARSQGCGLGLLPLYRALSLVLYPLGSVALGLGRALCRLFGVRPQTVADAVTEEDIRLLVDEGGETGAIEQSQKDMIAGIFELDDITAEDIMTHRTEITAVELSGSIQDVVGATLENGFSRIPIYQGDLDDIVGIVFVKDLLQLVGRADLQACRIEDFMRPVFYVPEAMKCRDLFAVMTQKHAQVAVVADEYGGTAGLVSMEDILESIVGNIQDEYDTEEEEIQKQSDDSYIVDGAADLDDICEELGLSIDYDDSLYDTVAGFITDVLGRIPDDDETPAIEYGGYQFQVLKVEERRIAQVRICKLPPCEETADADSAEDRP